MKSDVEKNIENDHIHRRNIIIMLSKIEDMDLIKFTSLINDLNF